MKKIIAAAAGVLLAVGVAGTAQASDNKPVASPKVYADINTYSEASVSVKVRARQPVGTRPNDTGARYRIEKVSLETGQSRTVSRGFLRQGDMNFFSGSFPKAKSDFKIRVVSYGQVVRSLKVRVAWPTV